MRLIRLLLVLAVLVACALAAAAPAPDAPPRPSPLNYKERFEHKRKEQGAAITSIREQEAIDELAADELLMDKLFAELTKSAGMLNEVSLAQKKDSSEYEWKARTINMANPIAEHENTAYFGEAVVQMPKSVTLINRKRPARQIILRFGVEFCLNSGLFDPQDAFLQGLSAYIPETAKKLTLKELAAAVDRIFQNYQLEEKYDAGDKGVAPDQSLSIFAKHGAYQEAQKKESKGKQEL